MDFSSLDLIPTEVDGVFAFKAPPSGFDAVHATDEELRRFGFPPRPRNTASEQSFSDWLAFVQLKVERVIPRLERTNIFHGPAMNVVQNQSTVGTIDSASDNWSGIVINDSSNPFVSTNTFIQGRYSVPTAHIAPITGPIKTGIIIDQIDEYIAHWVGIDGLNSPDVLQCGSKTDARWHHINGNSSENYFWIEWYPLPENRITNLPLRPGDQVELRVIVQSPNTGTFVLLNATTGQSVSLAIVAPSGTNLRGNCIEWVVERPAIGSSLTRLAGYSPFSMVNCAAQASQDYMPGLSPTGTIWNLKMNEMVWDGVMHSPYTDKSASVSQCVVASMRPAEIDFSYTGP